MYDIIVVGLGPCGASFARYASKRYSICCIDKKSMTQNSGFTKPCGGLIAPDARDFISEMGLTLPKDVFSSPQIFSVKTIDIGTKMVRHYKRFYLNMDRAELDRYFMNLIPENVALFDESRVTCIRYEKEMFHITFVRGSETKTVSAKYLVGADGAKSIVRDTFFKKRIRQYISIQEWYKKEVQEGFYLSVFDNSITDCYSWGLSKDKHVIFGGAYPLDNANQRFNAIKERLKPFGYNFKDPVKREACLVNNPNHIDQIVLGNEKVFLAGEAAGFISPSSLEGISYALKSGYYLYEAFMSPFDTQKVYRQKCLSLKLKIGTKLLKSPFLYNPTLRRLVMQSGLQATTFKT